MLCNVYNVAPVAISSRGNNVEAYIVFQGFSEWQCPEVDYHVEAKRPSFMWLPGYHTVRDVCN